MAFKGPTSTPLHASLPRLCLPRPRQLLELDRQVSVQRGAHKALPFGGVPTSETATAPSSRSVGKREANVPQPPEQQHCTIQFILYISSA